MDIWPPDWRERLRERGDRGALAEERVVDALCVAFGSDTAARLLVGYCMPGTRLECDAILLVQRSVLG